MASGQTRPEPMNASPHHSKVKVSLTLAGPTFVAGGHISGKMEMECRADKGLGISVMMVELLASQELTSRDHSATSMFLHSRRLFQGPGLPPSNAVQAHPLPGDPPLPQNHHQARRGVSTFLFRIPIPSSAPSSINFGADLARVKYEVRASVGVFWKGEKRLVVNKREIEVVESFELDFSRAEPEAVVVGEYGKIWAQGRLVGGMAVAGESACIELQVKNHSSKKNTGLVLTMTRNLILPPVGPSDKPRLQLSDTLTTVPFRGPEYIIPPGAEGVASLVFDVPKNARGVRGGTLEGDESEGRTSESLFEIRCVVGIKMTMGLGSKDINLELPVTIVHPLALPEIPPPEQYIPPAPYPYAAPQAPYSPGPYAYPALPMSPPIPAFVDQHHVWLPPPMTTTPQPHQYYSPPIEGQQYYFPPPPTVPVYVPIRPLSAGPPGDAQIHHHATGMPLPASQHLRLPLDLAALHPAEPEEGKGERASRVTHHLRLSSRHRSVSPRSHRFPLPPAHPLPIPPSNNSAIRLRNLPVPPQVNTGSLSTSQDAVVHSPRPFLSPKQSYSKDSTTHNSIPKSMRVEELERMADEVMATTPDLSADIPKAVPQIAVVENTDEASNVNKTLPKPPLPTITERRPSPLPRRTRVDTYFTAAPEPPPVPVPEPAPIQPVPSEKTPPTPTLTATTPAKPPKPEIHHHHLNNLLGDNLNPRAESGLDALERRLLAEVGTRKIDMGEGRRADVRSIVQPITIPTNKEPHEPLNDSAISSLTLAGGEMLEHEVEHDPVPEHEHEQEHDSDEKTHRAAKSSISGDEQASERRKRRREREKEREREREKEGRSEKGREGKSEKRSGRKRDKERGRDGEGHKTRKSAAKGRVAAWLGEIDPEVPPPEEEVTLTSPTTIKSPLYEFGYAQVDERQMPSFEAETEGVVQIVPRTVTPKCENENKNGIDAEEAVGHGRRHGLGNGGQSADRNIDHDDDTPRPKTQDAEKDTASTSPSASAPNPRSSGFVPIGTLKRDTFQRRPATRDTSVAEEARRVAEIWSSPPPPIMQDANPRSPLRPIPVMATPTQAYVPQSIRTDCRVSPPSLSSPLDELGRDPWVRTVKLAGKAVPESESESESAPAPVRDPTANHSSPPKPSPLPVSFSQAPTPKKPTRLPAFPPPPPTRIDPEVKYDIRSARGGRGGKVTAVASIWASGAFNTSSGTGAGAGGGADQKPREAVGVSARKKEQGLGPIAEGSTTPKPIRPSIKSSYSAGAIGGGIGVSAGNGNSNGNGKSEPSRKPETNHKDPKPGLKAGMGMGMGLGMGMGMSIGPGGKRSKPITKSTSVPAVLSSSHATPTLSSTASLARPAPFRVGAKAGVRVPSAVAEVHSEGGGVGMGLSRGVGVGVGERAGERAGAGAGAGAEKAVGVGVGAGVGGAGGGELAFGQARLRDLIRKYQGS